MGVGVLGAAEGAQAGLAARMAPRLLGDTPQAVDAAPEASLAVLWRPVNARAQREKGPPPGVCDYPGAFVPCWCAHLWGFGPCDSAEDYEEDVQRFGPPRAFVPLHPGMVNVPED
jgi:hypothetical protein